MTTPKVFKAKIVAPTTPTPKLKAEEDLPVSEHARRAREGSLAGHDEEVIDKFDNYDKSQKSLEELTIEREKSSEGMNPTYLIRKLMESQIQSHVWHLQVFGEGSRAMHEAFAEYYDAIPGLIDRLAETQMGYTKSRISLKEGSTYRLTNLIDSNPSEYFHTLSKLVCDCKNKFPEYLQNIMDDIEELINLTSYKLTLQ